MRKTKTKSIRSVKEILSSGPHARLLAKNGLNNGLLELIHAQLSSSSRLHCVNAQRQDTTLIIHVDSPVWASKLRFQLTSLLTKLRKTSSLKDLQQIQLRILPAAKDKAFAKPPAPSLLSEESAEMIRDLANGISDDTLRASWLKLAKNSK